MLILSSKYLGQIRAGMQSLLECDSLSWSAVDFRHWCEHCPATHSHGFSPLHTQTRWIPEGLFLCLTHVQEVYVGDNTTWQHGFPFPAIRCVARSGLDTRPLPPFQKLLPLCFCFDWGQWEWCLLGPVGDLIPVPSETTCHSPGCLLLNPFYAYRFQKISNLKTPVRFLVACVKSLLPTWELRSPRWYVMEGQELCIL